MKIIKKGEPDLVHRDHHFHCLVRGCSCEFKPSLKDLPGNNKDGYIVRCPNCKTLNSIVRFL